MSGAPERARRRPRRTRTGTTRRIWQLAWPAILTNLLQSTVGLVGVGIVGRRLGAEAVAATGIGNRIFFFQQVVLMAVTAGTTALVARAWGAGQRGEAERVTRTSLWLCLGLAAALAVPSIVFADALAGIFRLDAETHELTATYIRWISLSTPFLAANFAIGTALRAAGDTLTPLGLGALTMGVNVVALYALVFGALGMPALGVKGAAIASDVALGAGALATVALWLRGALRIGFGTPGGDFEPARVRRLVRIGTPAGIEQAAFQIGFTAFIWIVALYGNAANAAYQIGVQILSFSFLVGLGFSIAASTLVGQNLGAGDPVSAERSGWRAMWLAIGVMVFFGTSIIWFAEPIARVLIDDDEVVRLAVVFIRLLGSVQALMAIEFTLGGALRGAGDTRFPLFVVLAGMVVMRLGTAFTLRGLGFSVEWIYAALIADYVVKAVMLVGRFRGGRWKDVLDREPAPDVTPIEPAEGGAGAAPPA
jgi:putative MATE family efflux protein